MAITINEFRTPIDAETARSYLQHQTDTFGVFFDVDRCYELVGRLHLDMLDYKNRAREISCSNVNLDDKDSVIQTLVRLGAAPGEFNYFGKSGTLNAAVRNYILNNASYPKVVHDVVKLQELYASAKRNKGNILNYALLPQSVALSKYNHRMSVGHPTWKILSTSRLGAKDPGIQGIPRNMGDIITEPKGYTLIRCDSGQIEPRINFSTYLRDELIMNLIIHYNDAYYGILNYCQMNDEYERACREDFKKNFSPLTITKEIEDMRQLIKRMTNAGSYGSGSLTSIHPVLGKLYETKIVKHPARLAMERKVTQDVRRGVDTFYSMFGTPVRPDSTERYDKADSSWQEHLIRCGINNPVQTTASDLMLFSINEAMSILRDAKDTHVCFYKHDEACFYVSDEDMANGVGDKLADITAYNVKGWIPIEAEAEIGVKKSSIPTVLL